MEQLVRALVEERATCLHDIARSEKREEGVSEEKISTSTGISPHSSRHKKAGTGHECGGPMFSTVDKISTA